MAAALLEGQYAQKKQGAKARERTRRRRRRAAAAVVIERARARFYRSIRAYLHCVARQTNFGGRRPLLRARARAPRNIITAGRRRNTRSQSLRHSSALPSDELAANTAKRRRARPYARGNERANGGGERRGVTFGLIVASKNANLKPNLAAVRRSHFAVRNYRCRSNRSRRRYRCKIESGDSAAYWRASGVFNFNKIGE